MNVILLTQKALKWRLFSRAEPLSGIIEIIKWWELRRIPYNIIVGAAGICTSIITVVIAATASEKFGEPLGFPDPPIIAVFAIIAYGIGANICFAGGWIAEIFVRKIWQGKADAFGQISFFLGLLFSILLTLAPAVLFSVLLVLRLLLKG